MTVIGITGGTGAGKTTALEVLSGMGALIIDCDEVYHRLIVDSEGMKAALDERFPGVITDGVLDRKALGRHVFQDEAALSALNRITHAFVKERVEELIKEHEASGGTLAAIDAIALIECGLGDICDCTVAVTAPEDVRAERIIKREGISYDYAMLRIRAQQPDSFFRENCDYMLVNDCADAGEFSKKCGEFFAGILGGIKDGKRQAFLQSEERI